MNLSIECGKCGESISIPEALLGKPMACPKCGNSIITPSMIIAQTEATQEPQEESPKPNATRPCPFCGDEILLSASKCKHCGKFFSKCKFCGEEIAKDALKCKHCGEWLDDTGKNKQTNSTTSVPPASAPRRIVTGSAKTHATTKVCPYCGQSILRTAIKCNHCGEFLRGSRRVETNVKQGALIGAFVCFIIGICLMMFTLWSMMVYAPVFLAAFILSIVAMAQGRTGGGITMMLLTLIVPPAMFFGLAYFRTGKALRDASDEINETAAQIERSFDEVTVPSAPPPSSRVTRPAPQQAAGPQEADFEKVMFEPEKYKGKTLKSTVQIVHAGYGHGDRATLVLHSLGLGSDLMIYCSKPIADKGVKAITVIGQHGVITITYKIIDPSQMSAFNGYKGMQILDLSLD